MTRWRSDHIRKLIEEIPGIHVRDDSLQVNFWYTYDGEIFYGDELTTRNRLHKRDFFFYFDSGSSEITLRIYYSVKYFKFDTIQDLINCMKALLAYVTLFVDTGQVCDTDKFLIGQGYRYNNDSLGDPKPYFRDLKGENAK